MSPHPAYQKKGTNHQQMHLLNINISPTKNYHLHFLFLILRLKRFLLIYHCLLLVKYVFTFLILELFHDIYIYKDEIRKKFFFYSFFISFLILIYLLDYWTWWFWSSLNCITTSLFNADKICKRINF